MADVRTLADFHTHVRATTGCGSILQRLIVIAIDVGCKPGVLGGHLRVLARETEFFTLDGREGGGHGDVTDAQGKRLQVTPLELNADA